MWQGFKLIGDNVDKNIKPRNMRLGSQTSSLHYFNTYAVKDRINFQHLSANATLVFKEDIDFKVFFPGTDDNAELVSNFETLVTRILVLHVPGLQHLSGEVTHHIEHMYSKNMATKSIVVGYN